MPINPSIRNLLEKKDETISKEQKALEKLFVQMGGDLVNFLVQMINNNSFDIPAIIDAINTAGYPGEVADAFSSSVSLMNYSQQLSSAMGLNVILTNQAEAQLLAFMNAYENKLSRMFREEIADDLFTFAVESKLAGRSSREIRRLATERLEPLGRRAGTEVATALSNFDRATMGAYYDEAGIDRFVYWGPRDEVTRETCKSALRNPKQQTGWTREEIDADPGVDFVLGGKPYFNCRHEWLPFNVVSPEVAV